MNVNTNSLENKFCGQSIHSSNSTELISPFLDLDSCTREELLDQIGDNSEINEIIMNIFNKRFSDNFEKVKTCSKNIALNEEDLSKDINSDKPVNSFPNYEEERLSQDNTYYCEQHTNCEVEDISQDEKTVVYEHMSNCEVKSLPTIKDSSNANTGTSLNITYSPILSPISPQSLTPVLIRPVPKQFILKPIEMIEEIIIPEMKSELFFKYKIKAEAGFLKTPELLISNKKIKNIVEITQAKVPYYVPIDTCEKVARDFRQSLYGIKSCVKYLGFGWIPGTQKFIYNSSKSVKSSEGGLIDVFYKANINLTPTKILTATIINCIFNLASPTVVAEYLCALLLGPIAKIFKECRFPVRFIFFVIGRTGTFKTALARVFFDIYKDSSGAYLGVRRVSEDTAASIDVVIESTHDRTIVYDDLSPTRTSETSDVQVRNIEKLIRAFGDGTTCSKSNQYREDIKGQGVNGVLFVTGEFCAEGFSSNLRVNYFSIKENEVNTNYLTFLQNNPNAISGLLIRFIEYVEKNYTYIQNLIMTDFSNLRFQTKKLKERTVDCYCTLYITLEIFKRFLYQQQLDAEFVNAAIAEFQKAIYDNALFNDSLSNDYSWAYRFVRFITSAGLKIKEVTDTLTLKSVELPEFHCYSDSEYFYYEINYIFKAFKDFEYINNRSFHESSEKLWMLLANEGLIETFPNGRLTPTKYKKLGLKNGNAVKMIVIRKSKLEEILNNI